MRDGLLLLGARGPPPAAADWCSCGRDRSSCLGRVDYEHFGGRYRSLERTGEARSRSTRRHSQAAAQRPRDARPWYRRTLTALDQSGSIGLADRDLALVGAWVSTPRLPIVDGAICAWGADYLAFLAVRVMRPRRGIRRYAAEFMAEWICHVPRGAVLAARGAIWMWRTGMVARLAQPRGHLGRHVRMAYWAAGSVRGRSACRQIARESSGRRRG